MLIYEMIINKEVIASHGEGYKISAYQCQKRRRRHSDLDLHVRTDKRKYINRNLARVYRVSNKHMGVM